MGKILKGLLVVAAIAVNFIPGVGQALSAALVNAGLAAGVSVGTGIAIAGAVAGLVTVAGLASFAGLIGLGPSAPKPETTESSVRTPIPARVSCYGARRLFGAQILMQEAENGTAVDAWAFHQGRMDQVLELYFGDDEITRTGTVVDAGTDGRYKNGAVNVYLTTGATPGTANFSALQTLLPGIWTANHRGDGVVIGAVTAKAVKAAEFQQTYPSGGPPQPLAIAGRWLRVYDWRDAGQHPTLESTWTWSENPVLHLVDYLRRHQYGMAWTPVFGPHLAKWTAAANDCDTTVALKAGGTEKRYRGCVAYKWTDERKAVIASLLACFDGWMCEMADGNPVVYSGRYYAPTVTLGPDEIVAYSWDYGVEDESAVNELAVSFVSPDHKYNTVECDPWRDEADIAARGRVNSAGFDPQVPSHGQARRLAKRYMFRTNAKNRMTITTNALGRAARGERYINVNLTEAGATFYNGPAEVLQLLRNPATGGYTITCVGVSSAIDAWTPSSEEGNKPPAGAEVGQYSLTTPVITGVSVDFGKNNNGRLVIDITAPDRDDLTWFARWKEASDSEWGPANEYKDKAAGAAVQLKTELILIDETLDVQVRYEVGDGRESLWSAAYTINATSDNAKPDKPRNVDSSKSGSDVTVKWKNPTAYVDTVRVFRNTANNFGTATDVSGPLDATPGAVQQYLDAGLANGSYWWWPVAYSVGGVASDPGGPTSKNIP